jgi:hypothetical protein
MTMFDAVSKHAHKFCVWRLALYRKFRVWRLALYRKFRVTNLILASSSIICCALAVGIFVCLSHVGSKSSSSRIAVTVVAFRVWDFSPTTFNGTFKYVDYTLSGLHRFGTRCVSVFSNLKCPPKKINPRFK